jgi:two-component system KDP operon response regulator KdpE
MMKKKILIVDDEKELLKAMEIRFSSWGYEVLTAESGKEAIFLVKEEKPDAVILDIMMPQMDGIETLKRIRHFNKTLPILMFTAYSDAENLKSSIGLGISGFVPKGPEFSDVSQAIRTILKGITNVKNK